MNPQEKYKKECSKIHNDYYDYSKTKYTRNDCKIIFDCPKHGEKQQIAKNHKKYGCGECSKELKQNNKKRKYINIYNKKYNNYYDYSKMIYINSKSTFIVICPKHGEYETCHKNHIRNKCPECIKEENIEKQKIIFINKANKIHEDYYDYSKIVYKHMDVPVSIICPKHGSFEQRPSSHIYQKAGCLDCATEKMTKYHNNKITEYGMKFFKDCTTIHNNKYDYTNSVYNGIDNNITIICPTHGKQIIKAYTHKNGHGCVKCAFVANGINLRYTTQEYIEKCITNGLDKKYDLSYITYTTTRDNIVVKCKKHNYKFNVSAGTFLSGNNCCPKCSRAGYSKKQLDWLYIKKIIDNTQIQHMLNGGEYKINNYKVDGYSQCLNKVYEFHGDYWHGNPKKFKPDDVNKVCDKQFKVLYNHTKARINKLKEISNVEEMWEYDWDLRNKLLNDIKKK